MAKNIYVPTYLEVSETMQKNYEPHMLLCIHLSSVTLHQRSLMEIDRCVSCGSSREGVSSVRFGRFYLPGIPVTFIHAFIHLIEFHSNKETWAHMKRIKLTTSTEQLQASRGSVCLRSRVVDTTTRFEQQYKREG